MTTEDILFEVKTPLGITIHTTKDYWKIITTIKHPSMVKYRKEVEGTLKDPDQIRKSKQDPRYIYITKILARYLSV